MKKLTFSVVIALSGLCGTAEAQVGINTALPAASLDITAKNTTGNSPTVDGVLIPRVDRQRAQSMLGVPASTLLYVNSVATGTQLGTAINIDSMGYYYFDGFVWVKLYNPTNATYALGNIYTTSGTLNSNRVVNQDTFPLTFTNSLVNGFSVGGSTFSVDALNSRVGIGTAAPHAQLHLGSTLANRKIVMYETGDNDNEFYGFGVNSGIMRYQADRTTTDHVFYAGLTGGAGSNELMRIKGTGNVGIGTSAPENRFQVVSATAISNRYTLFDAPSAANQFAITALRNTSPIATGNYALLGFTNAGPTSGGAAWGMGSIRTGATGVASEEEFMLGNSLGGSYLERMRVTAAGNFGIATSTPQKTLHVNGALQVTNELNVGGNASTAGSAGTAGQILSSNGAAAAPSWQTFNNVSGTVASANYVQGTSALTINAGTTADVPGATITLTVPTGRTQTFLFTIIGYATLSDGNTTQGVFTLLQNGTKISSAYTSKAGQFPAGSGGTATLNSMPIPVTFLKSVSLPAGTYTFKVQYVSWAGAAIVNYIPTTYSGYNGDVEAMLTKMQVLVYNN